VHGPRIAILALTCLVACVLSLPPGGIAGGSRRAGAPSAGLPPGAGAALLAEARASIAAGAGPPGSATALNRSWTNELGPAPSAYDPVTWDGADRYVLLVDLSDQITWGYSGNRWAPVAGAAETPSLGFASLAYDAKDGYVLAFGVGYSCWPSCDATWSYRAGHWTNLTANLTSAPPGRSYAEMSWDSHDGYVVLFGGFGSGYRYFNDTWSFVAGAWTPQHPSGRSPAAVADTSMADDAPDGYVLLYGGYGSCNTHGGGPQCEDTWSYASGNWTLRLTPKAPHPTGVEYDLFAVDPANSRPLVFGGEAANGYPENDTWEYHGGHWTQLAPVGSPGPEIGATGAGDPVDNQTVEFGGNYRSTMGETWRFAGGNWTPMPTGAPPASFLPAMTYDVALHRVLLFGGASPSSPRGQTWSYTTGSWTRLDPPNAPSPRFGAAMMYDAKDRTVVLFGGCGSGGNPDRCPRVLGDTWSFSGRSWTNLTANLTSAPPPRFGAAITYDSVDGYVLLFGGAGPSGLLRNDTWSFVGGRWTHWSPASAPSPRDYAALANDPAASAALLFGGCGVSLCPLGDTWSFAGGNWTRTTAGHAPLGRYGAAIWFDGADDDLVLEGGIVACGSSLCLNAATWEFQGGNWTKLAPATSPPLGAFAGRAYDGLDGYPMQIGGCANVVCSSAGNTTWRWAPT